jgi:hypothetical protein
MDQKTFSVVAADLYELAGRDCRLVGTDVGELGRPRHRWWPRLSCLKGTRPNACCPRGTARCCRLAHNPR